MRIPSVRAVVGNLIGLTLLGTAGAAFGGQISFDYLQSISGQSTAQMEHVLGWIVKLPSSASNVVSHVWNELSGLSGYIPCVVDNASTYQCWPVDSASVPPVLIAANTAAIPEPSGIAVLAIAVAAIAFAVARWRNRRSAGA